MSTPTNNNVSNREARFRQTVRRWWKANRRDLPWRHTRDPYRILVSEIMLQQTQADRVIPKYREFLKRFPSLLSLSRAPRAEVLRAWSGLGYNRRAVNLHRAAQYVSKHYRGHIPKIFRELTALPGVGDYTARAVLAFAHNAPAAPVDTNIRRILIRHFGRLAEQNLQKFAEHILPKRNADAWSQALMDFGALVCTSRDPRCGKLRLPHVAEAPRPRPQGIFYNSDRYWRGNIVRILGMEQRAMSVSRLRVELARVSGRRLAKKRMEALLLGLERDELLRSKDAAGFSPWSFVRLA